MDYNNAVAGGTFDRFHAGHAAFLTFAFSKAENVTIGITTDAYVLANKKDANIEQYEKRKESVTTFLARNNLLSRATIIPIDTLYGPTLSPQALYDAIIVTEDTREGAEEINKKRQELHIPLMQVCIVPLVKEANMVISSTRIRNGEIGGTGEPFVDPKWYSTSYRMPEGLRLLLHKPFGTLLQDNIEHVKTLDRKKIVTVGDVTTKNFLDHGIVPIIAVIDFIVERKKSFSTVIELGFTGNENIVSLSNPPSTISRDIWNIVKEIIRHIKEKKSNIILVTGEEDLLVLPLILVLPNGFFIFYGQPNAGYVQIEITDQLKEDTRNLFALFKEIA